MKKRPKNSNQVADGSIDAGLMLLLYARKPDGGVWSHREIASVCGCSRALINYYEQAALKKLRRAFEKRGIRHANYLDGGE
jgi:hypothetical protein